MLRTTRSPLPADGTAPARTARRATAAGSPRAPLQSGEIWERGPRGARSLSHRPSRAGTSLHHRLPAHTALAFVLQLATGCSDPGANPDVPHQGPARFLVAAGDAALDQGRLDEARRHYEEAVS